ncbi:MAG: HEPN domain-containing protein [Candidatus Aminicenantes bacterium]|nr:HEPN domain-containing protein [Candidatus Aminicenantes bacterium]
MTKTKNSISNWVKSSNYDIRTAEHMLKTGRYIYVLFMCHLSVEKLLKALYEVALKKIPPKTHNLVYLSKSIDLDIPEKFLSTIESLNDLSIVTRYPEDMDSLLKAFKKERVSEYLNRTEALLKWLKKDARLKR